MQPNILIITADQLSSKALGCYGNAYAQTPNIDAIAQRGMRFNNCYTPCPLCQPARAAYWTGLFPHQTGVLTNAVLRDGKRESVTPIPNDMRTVGKAFTEAGYQTVHFGKSHDAGALAGFQHIEEHQELPVNGDGWPVDCDSRQDRYTTKMATNFLREYDGKKPFLAAVELNNPHDICNYVNHHVGAHEVQSPNGELPPLPENFRDLNFSEKPLPLQYLCCSHVRQSQAAGWTEMNFRHYLAAYYHYLKRVDTEIGRIVETLNHRSDSENTLIFFFTDHGDAMASHGMVTKHSAFYEELTHIPMIVAGPDVARGECNGFTSLMDIAPTLYRMVGQPINSCWGIDLKPWIEHPRTDSPHFYAPSEWYSEWEYTIEPGRMIRTESFKYTRYLEDDGEELYDLDNDPGERLNLATDPEHIEQLERHRLLLREFMASTKDNFETLECNVHPRWRDHKPGYQYHTGPAAPEV